MTRWGASPRSGYRPVRRPTYPNAPNHVFDYLVRKDGPIVVTSKSLDHNSEYQSGYAFFDGLLRPRQSQAEVAGPGRSPGVGDVLQHPWRGLARLRAPTSPKAQPSRSWSLVRRPSTRRPARPFSTAQAAPPPSSRRSSATRPSAPPPVTQATPPLWFPRRAAPRRPLSWTRWAAPPSSSSTPMLPVPPRSPRTTATTSTAAWSRSPTRPAPSGPTATTSAAARRWSRPGQGHLDHGLRQG